MIDGYDELSWLFGMVYCVRPIQQAESERLRDTLKTIASYRNPATARDGVQAAAELARTTLDDLGLFEDNSQAGSAPIHSTGSG